MFSSSCTSSRVSGATVRRDCWAPGDPITALIDPELLARLSDDQIAALRRELGLDQPLPIRYLVWLGEVLQGDLGYSVVNRRLVSDEIVARLGPTLLLMGVSALVGIPIGIALGVAAAIRQYSVSDYASTTFSMTFIAVAVARPRW